MRLIKSALITGILFISYSGTCQYTDVINSNRPGKSMSAFSVGQTVFQTEFGVYGVKEKHDLLNTETKGFGSELSLRYGAFLEQLEFIVDLDYRNDKVIHGDNELKRSGLQQTTFGVKYLLYDPHKRRMTEKPNLYSWKANNSFSWKRLIPAIGFYAGVGVRGSENDFALKGEPVISPKLMLITQSQFGKNVFVVNVISEGLNSTTPTWAYVATLTHGFNEEWSGFVENQGIKNDNYSDAIIRGGAAYLLAENFQIDAGVGFSTKNTPSIMTASIGFSWRFDKNYLPSILPSDDEDSKEDKKKPEKKRVDEVETE